MSPTLPLRRRLASALAVALLLFSGSQAFAWNNHGHRTVAAVAWEHLSPAVRARTTELLKLNPYYPRWEAALPKTVTAAEHDELIFIQAATWPDEIKDRRSGYVTDRRQPDSPVPSDYSDKRRHTYWHFRDVPFSTDGTPLPAMQTPNAETEITRHRQTLASPSATDAQKSYALVWLLHLVGDIHQPLHAVTRVSRDNPRGDMGGNKVQILGADLEHATELHEFWDNALGTTSSLRAAVKLARSLPAANARQVANMDVKRWVDESFHLAVTKVYVAPIKDGSGPFRITENYRASTKSVTRDRAELAGERLASALHQDFSVTAARTQGANGIPSIVWYVVGCVLVSLLLALVWWVIARRKK